MVVCAVVFVVSSSTCEVSCCADEHFWVPPAVVAAEVQVVGIVVLVLVLMS